MFCFYLNLFFFFGHLLFWFFAIFLLLKILRGKDEESSDFSSLGASKRPWQLLTAVLYCCKERERKRKSVCACVRACMCVCVCVLRWSTICPCVPCSKQPILELLLTVMAQKALKLYRVNRETSPPPPLLPKMAPTMCMCGRARVLYVCVSMRVCGPCFFSFF